MAGRSQYYVSPSRKHVTEVSDFSGGMNSISANEDLSSNEMPYVDNVNLDTRGSASRRTGQVSYLPGHAGKGQGFFRYYRSPTDFDDVVIIAGKFYINDALTAVGDGTKAVQVTKDMEAAQFQDKLYIASGSGLIVYDGVVLTWAVPYAPKPLEALYVGTNALADNPDNYLQDGTGAVLTCQGVTFDKRYGVVNEFVTVSAFVLRPAGTTTEYKFERRYTTDKEGEWFLAQDWSTASTYTFAVPDAGTLEFRVSVRNQGDTNAVDTYYVPKYIIKPTADPKDEEVDSTTINTCNRILLHWDRLIMYGDDTQGDAIYISDLKNPLYFPTPNSLRFENTKKENLSKLIRYRDNIVAFTASTIQALFGKSPSDFQRIVLNTGVGCIAPNSVAVMANYIIFLSHEGIQILKSVGTSETKANVSRVDLKVMDKVPSDAHACGAVVDNQYHIIFPDSQRRLRFYYAYGTWVNDESPKMNFNRLQVYSAELYGQDQATGQIRRFDSTVYDDDGYIYEHTLEMKFFDFGAAYNPKKLKELQMFIADFNVACTQNVKIYLDDTKVYDDVITISKDTATITDFQQYASLLYQLRTFGKGMKVKVIINGADAQPFQLLSLGFIFKLKHP